MGNGDGTLQNAVTTSLGTKNVDVGVAGDFNSDGKMDLATGSQSSVAVSIIPGNGDGTFQAPVDTSLGPNMSVLDITAADFNLDGKLDLAVATCNALMGNGAVQVLLGRGDGTFTEGAQFPVSRACGAPLYVLAADMNNDGKPDLIYYPWGSYPYVAVGNGDGTFQSPNSFPNAAIPDARPQIADINGDGKLDIVVAGDGLTVFLGNGDGTIQRSVNTAFVTGSTPTSLTLADFNGDGKIDAAVWAGRR